MYKAISFAIIKLYANSKRKTFILPKVILNLSFFFNSYIFLLIVLFKYYVFYIK